MLQIKEISKEYITGDLHQKALDRVSVNLRDNEFVAILGPSGSGKTTLLNVIGGLDRYDSGDLVINNISTKKYKDRDWDSYRNHTIGFVFQSYNLIPHQSVLSNVELALTISGISRKERRARAKAALESVGLGDQLHKKPNQMSGGQMQRVAIARALVNDPDILLADEPTGALDTETSVQVMELLKEVARDRLVVMVTHNPELAETYATRIVKLRDGRIIDDSDPYLLDEGGLAEPAHKNLGKASMSFLTALSLSFNNLRTKKGRTLLTSFAGSIGIIGIALILSLSTGVKTYIDDIQKSTMTSYPITLEAQTIDLSGMMEISQSNMDTATGTPDHELDGIYSNPMELEMASSMMTSITNNNLTAFKEYLDDPDSEIHQYIGENGVIYSYSPKFGVYTLDPDGTFVNTDGSTLSDPRNSSNPMAMMGDINQMSQMGMMMNPALANFKELMPGQNGTLISPVLTDSYELLYGTWPQAYDEIILTVNSNHELSATTLYQLGMLPTAEYREVVRKIAAGEEVELSVERFTYEEFCGKELYMIPECDAYEENGDGTYSYIGSDAGKMKEAMDGALKLKIVGVVRPAEDGVIMVQGAFGYTRALTDYVIEYTNDSPLVQAQRNSPDVNVINGLRFAPENDQEKVADAIRYLSALGITEKAQMAKAMLSAMYANDPATMQQMMLLGETELAGVLDQYLLNPDEATLVKIYDEYIPVGSCEENLEAFGVVSLDAPTSINIYADSFEAKDSISECIARYNEKVEEQDKISYTDYVALLMSSVTTIIDVISYVLIAFVSVSLVVSSIMIGIITYISVLERTKEIGILRAIGASRKNISQVFNAETFIVGLCSGVIGIGVTLLALIPINALIHLIAETDNVNAILPVGGALLLVILSVFLTFLGGLIPSKKAARKDPVTALRTE